MKNYSGAPSHLDMNPDSMSSPMDIQKPKMSRNMPDPKNVNVEDLFKNKLMTFEDIDRLSI